MRDLRALLHLNRGRVGYGAGLDLGDGCTLPPEDVLDGHSTRLLAHRQRNFQTVPVQVNDLSAAITVMAPDLAPLADLAEEVAVAVPAVAPKPDFRRNLHEALERTHRQHRMQEALGTRPSLDRRANRTVTVLILTMIVLCVLGAVGWFAVRRTGSRRARGLPQ